MNWFACGAMLAGILPLLFMSAGYFYLSLRRTRRPEAGSGDRVTRQEESRTT